jgi:carboxylesterase
MAQIDETLFNPHLDGNPFYWPGSSTGLLLIHGYTATTAEVRLIAEKYKSHGFTISAPLLPGHGTKLSDLDRCKWQDWTTQVEKSYQDLASHCKKVIVAGESMGGLLSLHLLSKHTEIICGLVYSPAIKIQKLWASRWMYPFIPYIPKKNLDDGLAWQGYRYNSIRGASQLYELQRIVRKDVSHIQQPVAIFLGALDETIDIAGGKLVYDHLQNPAKRLYTFSHSTHCMILDRELDKIFEKSMSFLNTIPELDPLP